MVEMAVVTRRKGVPCSAFPQDEGVSVPTCGPCGPKGGPVAGYGARDKTGASGPKSSGLLLQVQGVGLFVCSRRQGV